MAILFLLSEIVISAISHLGHYGYNICGRSFTHTQAILYILVVCTLLEKSIVANNLSSHAHDVHFNLVSSFGQI